jgi:hypothetical protein
MDFVDASATKTCQEDDTGNKLWGGKEQVMVVKGQGYFVYLHRHEIKNESVTTPAAISDFADQFIGGFLQGPAIVSVHSAVSGYDVATFSGTLAKNSYPAVDCFVFLRYGGASEASSPFLSNSGGLKGMAGYTVALSGGYCARRTSGIPDSRIEQVLNELRTPAS